MNSTRSVFVTLTYNDLSLPMSPDGTRTLHMADVSSFLKRLRFHAGPSIRFFAVGEYGKQFNRPHYHLLLFNVPEDIEGLIMKTWPYGHIRVDQLTEGRIAYVCKYVLSSTQMFDGLPFTLGSRRINAKSLLSALASAPQSVRAGLQRIGFSDSQNLEKLLFGTTTT